MQPHGSELCGRHGADLQPLTLSGRGTLLSSTVVHLHADKARQTPFAIGTIALAEGPVVRTLLVDADAAIAPGEAVKATLVPVEGGRHDLRFGREN